MIYDRDDRLNFKDLSSSLKLMLKKLK